MLKAEKQAIICTLYTQHTPLQPFPTTRNPVCVVPERRRSRSPSQERKKKAQFKEAVVTRQNQTVNNKINRKDKVLRIVIYRTNSFY